MSKMRPQRKIWWAVMYREENGARWRCLHAMRGRSDANAKARELRHTMRGQVKVEQLGENAYV